MPRPREFDIDEALDAAMITFWTQGYQATSMTDLVEATGLHKGSIYKAFDDKHDLFMKSLTRYLDDGYERARVSLSSTESPLGNLRAWLQNFVVLCCDQPVQRGCLAMNSAIELGPHDDQVRELLLRHHARASALLVETIENGQRAGELRGDLSADQIARTLFVFGVGLIGTSKILGETMDASQMVGSALRLVTTD
jgi:TetR/AcrR family transcriptional repressor of nem operon